MIVNSNPRCGILRRLIDFGAPILMFLFPRLRKAKNTGNLVAFFSYAVIHRPTILHVGAHVGQEKDLYSQLGFENRIWLEPVPKFFEVLKKNVAPDLVLPYALWSQNDEISINISADEVSSSVFQFAPSNPFHNMEMVSSEKVQGRTLDYVLKNDLSHVSGKFLLVLDTQGSELQVLLGISKENFKRIAACIVETSRIPLYAKAPTQKDIKAILVQNGFKPVISLSRAPTFHGDELFLPKEFFIHHKSESVKLLFLGMISKFSAIRFHNRFFCGAKASDNFFSLF